MFEELFIRKVLNTEKLLHFGFKKHGNHYLYQTDILDDQFQLKITISSVANIDTNLIEKDNNEEYVLYKTNAEGAFVGKVRNAVEAVLTEISNFCYETDIFKSIQTKQIIVYVREKYGDELEFLWKKSPNNAIWRRKDTTKWYGAILTISRNKLGIDSDEIVEILNLRIHPEELEALLKSGNYYPGWHMNKKRWCTIILDSSVSTDEICRRIDESHSLALK